LQYFNSALPKASIIHRYTKCIIKLGPLADGTWANTRN